MVTDPPEQIATSKPLPRRAKIAVACLSAIPVRLRERLIFGGERRQSLLQLLIGGPAQTMICFSGDELTGLRFNCFTSEKYFWLGSDYESDLASIVRETARGVSVVYDIGAHAGFYSLLFGKLCSQVFAFEPDPLNRARLTVNTAPLPNIHVLPFAVSDRVGTVWFEHGDSMSHIVEGGNIEVKTVTIDSCGLPPPELIKMDIEGHGAKALAGSKAIISEYRPRIIAEIHNDDELHAIASLHDLSYQLRQIEPDAIFPFHIVATSR